VQQEDSISPAPAGKDKAAKPSRLSDIVKSINTEDDTTIGTLVDSLGERAFGALMFIFAVPNIIPTPPGTSAILGLPLVILTWQVLIGRQSLWLPAVVRHRRISRELISAFVNKVTPVMAKLERILKPRMGFLVSSDAAERVIGLVTFPLAVALSSPVLTVMMAAVRKAARGVQRDYGELANLQVSLKAPGDYVTAADKKCDKVLREELTKAAPRLFLPHRRIRHVKGTDPDHRFIIDPIDGTMNFMHSVPHFAITIALERKDELVAAITYNPVTDEMFLAEKGGGAFLNNKRLRIAQRRDIHETVVSYEMPHRGGKDHPLSRAELAVLQGKRRRHPRPRFGGAVARLCGGGPVRRNGLPQPQPVGHRGGNPAGARGGRLRLGSRRREEPDGNRQHPRHQCRPVAAVQGRAEEGPRSLLEPGEGRDPARQPRRKLTPAFAGVTS
jgi:fructose-1,6-bisphosphatase/inositol monophosphatase family enzyme